MPYSNTEEAAAASGNLPVIAVNRLAEAVEFFTKGNALPYKSGINAFASNDRYIPDFADVKGQLLAKRTLEIAQEDTMC